MLTVCYRTSYALVCVFCSHFSYFLSEINMSKVVFTHIIITGKPKNITELSFHYYVKNIGKFRYDIIRFIFFKLVLGAEAA